MSQAARTIDIDDVPELVSLVEEVCLSREARVLRRHEEDVARIVPIRRTRLRKPKSAADHEAFLASLGGWADVDVDAFLAANRESRDRSTRPAVEL